MLNKLKQWILPFVPRQFTQAVWANNVEKKIKSEAIVRGGIFKGMKYVSYGVGSPNMPKLVGCYEIELTPVLSQLNRAGVKKIVDIGAGEGYYAVGLALLYPDIQVIAFEEQSYGQDTIHCIAKQNGVSERVHVQGRCEASDLANAIDEDTFLLVDIEGYEVELLDPLRVEALLKCIILFEAHDLFIPNAGRIVTARFEATHDIQVICSRPRTANDLLCSSWIERNYFLRYCVPAWTLERPEPMCWFYMVPKSYRSNG
jgi:hypothetical protein